MADDKAARIRRRIERLEDRLDDADDATERRYLRRSIDKLEDRLDEVEAEDKAAAASAADAERIELDDDEHEAVKAFLEERRAASKAGGDGAGESGPTKDEKPPAGSRYFKERTG